MLEGFVIEEAVRQMILLFFNIFIHIIDYFCLII